MKAVVLVGGRGTRLRPLTDSVKKELLPLVDRTILDHTLDRLVRHGVHEVLMSSPYLEEAFDPFIEQRAGEPKITWITETQALDTGGAVVNAIEHLEDDEPFFALNGDILTDLDMTSMLAVHEERGAFATIALHRVDDARAFGLVVTGAGGRILEFREKPGEPIGAEINAGTYVLQPGGLARWSADRAISIEREIFPEIIASGQAVFGFSSTAYWRDLGTPENYLQAHFDMLDGRLQGLSYPAPWVAESAKIDRRAEVGPHVAVGPGAVVEGGARLDECVLHRGAVVEADAQINGSIVGSNSIIRRGARLASCVIGEGAVVKEGDSLEGERVAPGPTSSHG